MAANRSKRKKHDGWCSRTHSWEFTGPSSASWERPDVYDESAKQLEHGQCLEELLIMEYALGHLSARTLCTLSWHAVKAGAKGNGLAKLMLDPDNCSGNFQKHLDAVLPKNATVELYDLLLPLDIHGVRQEPWASQPLPLPNGQTGERC